MSRDRPTYAPPSAGGLHSLPGGTGPGPHENSVSPVLAGHATFYKAIYRPAVLRANRLTPTAKLSPAQSFHSLRHTYASLCVAAGIKPGKLSGRMGHANVRTTLDVYVHLFPDDDATEDMAALGALATAPKLYGGNVIPLHG
jgi:integrase